MPRCFSSHVLLVLALLVSRALATEALPPGAQRAASGEEIALLNEVLHKTADDLRRWAYTERRVIRDDKGRVKSEQVIRFDPSKPYAEQWTPITINGREPTERDRAKFRKRGERAAPSDRPTRASQQRRSLGEVLDVAHAFVFAETPTQLVCEIPLLKFGNERFPPENFQVLARIGRESRQLENITVKLRESFRAKLVVKIKSGGGSLDFAQPDPRYPPTMVAVAGDASVSMLFVSLSGSLELKRTELRHVKPFDERFDVQIGTLKAIDF
jgi:hypothetical protein